MADADSIVAFFRRWWFEALGALVALIAGGSAVTTGDALSFVVVALALVALADRVRLRMDNQSLRAQLTRVRARETGRVSAGVSTDVGTDGDADAGANAD